MKIFRILPFFILASLAFVSCKKDKDTEPAGNYFQYKVDGKAYNVQGILAYATTFSIGSETGIYGLSGDGNQEVCFLTVPSNTVKGTYAFNTSIRGNFTDLAKTDYSSLWGTGNGSVTIEEIDAAHIKGTFQFTAFDGDTETQKKTITEGKFNVSFR